MFPLITPFPFRTGLSGSRLRFFLITLGFLLGASLAPVSAAPRVEIPHLENANLVEAGSEVRVPVRVKGFPEGNGTLSGMLRDFFGTETRVTMPVSLPAPDGNPPELNLGVLEDGCYELTVTADIAGTQARSEALPFGVVRFVDRTAAEARAAGSRFGLKLFQIGKPGVWWRKGTVWDLSEIVDACAKLGLQWTRTELTKGSNPDEPGVMGTQELISGYPMNVILKVEGFPESCFDEQRYGPLEEFRKRKQKWNRQSVPMKEPYQKWLKEEVARIPEDQNVFEIGNEVWNYMSATEFAEWAQMAREAIQEARPDAVVGVDFGLGSYGMEFLEAGGLEGMTASFIHPYSFTPLPEHRIRGLIRDHHDIARIKTGESHDVYVTEYGWSAAPEGEGRHNSVVSETLQAERTTRASLMLYAEDVKALVPHMMGDREQSPGDWDDWFGFWRLDSTPRPVLVAHAVCARMIDGSRFVGDLWYGPGIGAMLFERDGTYTLALWTLEEEREVEVDIMVSEAERVNLTGGTHTVSTREGKLTLPLSGAVTYLVGVSPKLAEQAAPPGSPLRPDRWATRQGEFSLPAMAPPPDVDGDLSDWSGVPDIPLNPSKAAEGEAAVRLSWTAEHLHLALEVTGQEDITDQYIRFGLGVRPDRQIQMRSSALYDFFFLLPAPGSTRTTLEISNRILDGFQREVAPSGDDSGIEWNCRERENGWTAELSIPVRFLKGLPDWQPGTELSAQFRIQKDQKGRDPDLFGLGAGAQTREWPALILTAPSQN